ALARLLPHFVAGVPSYARPATRGWGQGRVKQTRRNRGVGAPNGPPGKAERVPAGEATERLGSHSNGLCRVGKDLTAIIGDSARDLEPKGARSAVPSKTSGAPIHQPESPQFA